MRRFADGIDIPILSEDEKLDVLAEFARLQKSASDRGEPIDEISSLSSRQDSIWKTVQVKASGDRKAYTRRIQVSGLTKPIKAALSRASSEINKNVKTGRGSEFDVKPAIEEIATGAAGLTPGWMGPIAATATKVTMRTWRLSYEDVSKSGIGGLMDGVKKLTPEQKQEIISAGMVKLAAATAGKMAGLQASDLVDLSVQGVNPAGTAAGVSTGVGASKATSPIAQRLAQRFIKDSDMTDFHQQIANFISQATDRSISGLSITEIADDGSAVAGIYQSGSETYPFRLVEDGDGYQFQDAEVMYDRKPDEGAIADE